MPRLAGKEAPSIEDNQKTFKDLCARIETTLDILKTAKSEDFVGKENIEVSMFNGKFKFTGLSYLQQFGLPK